MFKLTSRPNIFTGETPSIILVTFGILFLALGKSAYAAGDQQAPRQPKERLIVDYKSVPPNLLSPNALIKLKSLQSNDARQLQFLSSVDPSGTFILSERKALDNPVGFLNLTDGTFTAIETSDFDLLADDDVDAISSVNFDRLRWSAQSELVTWDRTPNLKTWDLVRINPRTRGVSRAPLDLAADETPVSLSKTAEQIILKVRRSGGAGIQYVLMNIKSEKRKDLISFSGPSTDGEIDVLGDFAWSNDDSKLAFVRALMPTKLPRGAQSMLDLNVRSALGLVPPKSNPILQENILEIFDLASNQNISIAANETGKYIFLGKLDWSPDGSTILALTQSPVHLKGRRYPLFLQSKNLGTYRIFSGNGGLLATLDKPRFTKTGNSDAFFLSNDDLIFNTSNGLSMEIDRYQISTAMFTKLSKLEGRYIGVRSDLNRGQLLFSYSSIEQPPELFSFEISSGKMLAITNDNQEAKSANAVQTHRMLLPSTPGKPKREALLIQPLGAQFPPSNDSIVIWQPGGPGGPAINEWSARAERPFNLLPNFGVAVLILPLQMRPSLNEEDWYALADAHNFGSIDIDEAAAIVKNMIASRYTSPKKIGIAGCSYGGYFTVQSIVRHPNLYAAANPACSMLDTISEFSTGYTLDIAMLMGGTPYEMLSDYRRSSPLYQASLIKTPTLIFHGTNDFCPVAWASNLFYAISSHRTPVRMVQFNDEGHGIKKHQENVQYQAQEQVNWFQFYLGAH